MPNYTPKLKIKLIDEKEYFADEAFNAVIEDADDKLVGISHLSSAMHWDEWVANKAYNKNDIIRYKSLSGGQYAKCITSGISDKNEPTDNVTGSKVKDGTVEWSILSLADLLFDSTKVDIWLSSESYSRGQVVVYNNCLYRCKTPHTSSSTFDLDALKWQEIRASFGMWKSMTYYFTDDIVVEDNLIYLCITAHVSESTFNSTEETYWEVIGGAGGISVWQDNKSYNEGQLVSYNNILYKANIKHTSTANFSADIANWDIVNAGLNSWATSVYYPAGIIVIANNKLYQCITAHTSTKFTSDEANWQEISGYRIVIDDWKATTDYIVGDLCAHDKKIYRCTVKHTSGAKFDSTEEANWEELSPTINEINDWKASTSYNAKDIVINDNALYRCKTAHTSTSDFATDALTYWVKLSGANAVSVWASSKSYDEGQLVVYNNQLFRANANHASSATFGMDGAKWNMLESNIGEYKPNVYYPIGTAVIYNNALFKCKVAHNSTSTFNRDNWTRIDKNNPLVKDWTASTYYYANDIVLYGNQLYRCNANHTSSNFSTDKANWTKILSSAFTFKANTYYEKGSIVEYNNKLYKANINLSDELFNPLNWELCSESVEKWLPHIDSSLYSIINFESDEYVVDDLSSSASRRLRFHDIFKRIYCYTESINSNTATNVGVDVGAFGYFGSSGCVVRGGGHDSDTILTIEGLDVFKGKKDFTFDCFIKFTSSSPLRGLTFFGVGVNWTYIKDKWTHITCCYDYVSNTVDWWVDGNYEGNRNCSVGSAIKDYSVAISAETKPIYVDNIRIRLGKKYTATNNNIPIPSANEYVLSLNRNYSYDVGDFAEYDGVLYRCIEQDSDLTFNADKWQQVANIVLTWNPNSYYFAGQLVMDGQTLLRCIEAHTSGADIDDSKWEVIADDKVVIKDWESSKKYSKDNVVFKDNVLYRCTAEHKSNSFDTELNDGYWIKVSGGSSGGGTGNYSQMVLMNVTAPKTYEIKIAETTDFCFPPVEILKFKAGQDDVVVDALTFDLSDGKLFEVEGISSEDSPYALYDKGKLYLNTEYKYKHGSTTSCGNGYTTISDEIDLSIFKNVDSVEVI